MENLSPNQIRFTSMGGMLLDLATVSAPDFDRLYDSLRERISSEPTWAKAIVQQELGRLDNYIAGLGRE